MSKPLPVPLNALRAIEIVARARRLGPAAEELGVTIGAVSQHIRRAEQRLGVTLFERLSDGMAPTPELEAVLDRLSGGFRQIGEAVDGLKPDEGNVLTVTVGSMIASLMLVPRLGRFTALHPEIEIRLVASAKFLDLSRRDIDCALRFGLGPWPGVRAVPIGDRLYGAYATPELVARLKTPADLAEVPVIQDESTLLEWGGWFAAAGGASVAAMAGPAFSDPMLAYDAAVTGQGVLLIMDRLARYAVETGRLVKLFGISAETSYGYYFATAEGRRPPARVLAFRRWLDAEMAAAGMP